MYEENKLDFQNQHVENIRRQLPGLKTCPLPLPPRFSRRALGYPQKSCFLNTFMWLSLDYLRRKICLYH